MGQYHIPVNLDKKEFIHPHKMGDGLKMLEFGQGGNTVTALTMLLANSQNRGGGDLHTENPIAGSWAGDRITIFGDYSEKEDLDLPEDEFNKLMQGVWGDEDGERAYKDISYEAMDAITDDRWIAQQLNGYLNDGSNYLLGLDEDIVKLIRSKKEK